jgi:hypothetical protein
MKTNRWMVFLWAAVLAIVVGVTALYGGRNCQVPKSGPFHWLLKNERFVPTGSTSFRSFACRRVK